MITPRSFTTLSVIATLLAACGSDDRARGITIDGSLRVRIVNGTAAAPHHDNVLRIDEAGDLGCTATLVANNLLLTAGHCVIAVGDSGECGSLDKERDPASFSILSGVEGEPTGLVGARIFRAASSDGCGNDIALLQLSGDVPGITPAKIRFAKTTLGEAAVTVGYGDDGVGGHRHVREQKAGLKVEAIGPSNYEYPLKTGAKLPMGVPEGEIVTGESTCVGDSGGPLFDGSGEVIGITSRGIDEECVDRPTFYTAVARHEDLIRRAFQEAGHALEPGKNTEAAAVAPAANAQASPQATPPTPAHASSHEADSGCSVANGARLGGAEGALWFGLALVWRGLRRRASRRRQA